MGALAWILGLSLGTSFTCSILEAVFLSVSHSYIGLLKEQGEWAGKWLEEAQEHVDEPIAAILTLNTIAHTVGATLSGAVVQDLFGDPFLTAFSIGLTLAVLIVSEIIPKTLGARHWRQLAKPTAHVLRVMVFVMKPILWPLGWLSRSLTPKGEQSTVSRDELAVLTEIGRREGTLDEEEWQVMNRIIRLDEVSVGEVMTPRMDMTAIPVSATIEEVQDIMLETGHLRVPVYRETVDNIIGILVARDIWRAAHSGIQNLNELIRDVPFTPTSKPVEDLIPEMRAVRVKMAVVVDEFGGTAGLVTLEDLIEEIVGEIQDEHEGDEPIPFQKTGDGHLRVWGGVSLRDAIARLGFTLMPDEEEGYDTIGGLVFGRLNRLPLMGDTVKVTGGVLQVAKVRGRRIEYLLFLPDDQQDHSLV